MNRLTRYCATAVLAAGLSATAVAGVVRYEYAPVVSVEPIYVTSHVPVDREICSEEHGYERHYHQPRSATPTIVGAIVGGVIGNQFGSGSGKRAATVAGAALGGSVAYDRQRQRHSSVHPVTRERCTIQRQYETRSRTSGYRVTYEYQGEIYETRTTYPPGDVIRVRVSVSPVN